MKTVAVVYGTRPEAIKLAPLIAELNKVSQIKTVVICTGQHKEMLDGIFELWGLKHDHLIAPDIVGSPSSTIPWFMLKLEKIFLEVKPDLVVVQGDTSSATAAALQAHALHILVAHVEAGLRSDDLWNPWPEESNRRVIDSVSSLHFAPTKSAAKNLVREGHAATTTITGNTVVDAIIYVSKELDRDLEIELRLETLLGFSLTEEFILFTQHRRESFGEGQTSVFAAILKLAKMGHKIVFPVHLNPLVRDKVNQMLINQPNIYLISPQAYLPFLALVRKCSLIISDSGGLQEEAPTFNKKIIITRLTTERPEVIESGFGVLVGYDFERITKLAEKVNRSRSEVKYSSNPFGNGNSAELIQKLILKFLDG